MKQVKSFFLLTFSIVIMAVGIYFFKFSNNFTFGGITGLAVLVAKSGSISASDFSFFANMILLLLGFLIFGKGFGIKTAYCTLLLSILLSGLERLVPMTHPLTDQPLLELTFAIALPSFGAAILFNIGASSGGTDILAMIFKKYANLNIGGGLLITNLIVTVAGFFVFDIKTGLFSLLGLAVSSLMIDNVIESINTCKYFNVVCSHPEPICNFIVNELHRSATTCHAKGAFSGDDRYIVFTAMKRSQAMKLRNFIKEQEPHAFILISNTSEIIGKGFHTV